MDKGFPFGTYFECYLGNTLSFPLFSCYMGIPVSLYLLLKALARVMQLPGELPYQHQHVHMRWYCKTIKILTIPLSVKLHSSPEVLMKHSWTIAWWLEHDKTNYFSACRCNLISSSKNIHAAGESFGLCYGPPDAKLQALLMLHHDLGKCEVMDQIPTDLSKLSTL